MYGTNVDDPFLSTKYSIASGHSTDTNELSAFGATFIIKAVQDSVQAPTINFSTPLSATLNGVNITDTNTEFLSGTLEVGLSGYKEDNCIYKTVYLDEPEVLVNRTLPNGMASWETFSLASINIPLNAKINLWSNKTGKKDEW